jgi:hypothetical protein
LQSVVRNNKIEVTITGVIQDIFFMVLILLMQLVRKVFY